MPIGFRIGIILVCAYAVGRLRASSLENCQNLSN
jgi:hypothetical protein